MYITNIPTKYIPPNPPTKSSPLKCTGRYHPNYFDVISGPRTFVKITFGNQCFVLLELELFFQQVNKKL